MKIGELASRTGTTTRSLRYYEEQGLLTSDRTDSNYREYGEDAVDKARQIRLLIESGMPTRLIRVLLPFLDGPDAQLPPRSDPGMAEILTVEIDRLNKNIERLEHSRDQIQCYLDRARNYSFDGDCPMRKLHDPGTLETHLLR